MINHIKVHVLNSCLFAQLCEEMGTGHTIRLLHTAVRRLSKGASLARVFELRELLHRFLLGNSHHRQHIAVTQNGPQNLQLAYLCDISNLLSELDLSLQRRTTTVFNQQIKWLHSKPNWNYGGDE